MCRVQFDTGLKWCDFSDGEWVCFIETSIDNTNCRQTGCYCRLLMTVLVCRRIRVKVSVIQYLFLETKILTCMLEKSAEVQCDSMGC